MPVVDVIFCRVLQGEVNVVACVCPGDAAPHCAIADVIGQLTYGGGENAEWGSAVGVPYHRYDTVWVRGAGFSVGVGDGYGGQKRAYVSREGA